MERDHVEGLGQGVIVAASGAGQHGGLRVGQQASGLALVEHLEMGRDAGLQGKAPEQGLAEGVDGQDLEPAGGVQHGGEQAARAVAQGGVRLVAAQGLERRVEVAIGLHGPFAEAAVEARAHLGRRRLGEGQAEQPLGRGAAEQQAQHPVGQCLGLAGPGRGGDPDRGSRVGGAALIPGDRKAGLGAGHSPPSPKPWSDHSLSRARWA